MTMENLTNPKLVVHYYDGTGRVRAIAADFNDEVELNKLVIDSLVKSMKRCLWEDGFLKEESAKAERT